MSALLAWLAADARAHEVAGAMLVVARVAPLVVLAPFLLPRAAPATLRMALPIALALPWVPLGLAAVPDGALAGGVAVFREIVLGTLFAVAVALPFHALEGAGQLVDLWRGSSLAEVIAPPTGERTSPIGNLLFLLAIAIFVGIGGLRAVFAAFAMSLEAAPIGHAPIDAGVAALGLARLVGAALALSASIAAPAGLAIVLAELALGLVGRAAPGVPVFFVGMPVRAALGLAAMLLALTLVVEQLPSIFLRGIDDAGALVGAAAGH